MTRFGKRSQRFIAMLWIGTIAAELLLLELARRTDNSWILLLALALLVVPIAAMDWTWRWFSRPARKRWKRHDVEDALAAAARSPQPPPAAHTPAPAATHPPAP